VGLAVAAPERRLQLVPQCTMNRCAAMIGAAVLLTSSCERSRDPLPHYSPPESENLRILDARSITGAPAASAEADIVLGERGSSPQSEFGLVMGVAVDSRENFYVLDHHAVEVRQFDTNGRFVRSFGKRGKGPGEFERPHGLVLVHDTLYVLEQRLQAFHLDGRLVPFVSVPMELFSYGNFIFYGGGRIIISRGLGTRAKQSRVAEDVFYSYDPRTRVINELARIGTLVYSFGNGVEGPGAMSILRTPVAITTDGRIVSAVSDSFHLQIRSPDGRLAEDVVARVPRVETTDDDFDAFVDKVKTYTEINAGDVPLPDYRKQFKRGPRAQYRPAIGAMVATDDGGLLVKRFDTSQSPYSDYDRDARAQWLLLSPELHPVANFELPTGFSPSVVRHCKIWGSQVLRDGTPLVSRYRLSGYPGCW